MTIQYRRRVASQSYDVFADNVLVGSTTKRSQSFNLRRPVTVHYWLAVKPDGERLRAWYSSMGGYRTRTEAAEALIEAAS